jgi:hypothetical protein
VDPAERVGDTHERRRLADLLHRDLGAFDEAGHEIALGPDEGCDLRTDADAGGRDGRRVLDLAADAEQVRIVAREPDDVTLRDIGDCHEEVAVRDPTAQRGERQRVACELRDALHRADKVVTQLTAELGG